MERKLVWHKSVLLQESIELLDPQEGDVYLDATLGGAGHAIEFCKLSSGKAQIVGIEADRDTLEYARERLMECSCSMKLIHGNFGEMESLLKENGINSIDKILFDLGMSEFTLRSTGRGFSFLQDEPLDMRMDPDNSVLTASDLLRLWSEEDIEKSLSAYGGERYSREIAKAIVIERKDAPIDNTVRLVKVIENAVPANYKRGKIHPATRTFQALRVAVNDEVMSLKKALDDSFRVLNKEGIMVVISFHGLETKIVRNFFNDKKKKKEAKLLTTNAVKPNREELKMNPKSRSAILRAVKKN